MNKTNSHEATTHAADLRPIIADTWLTTLQYG
jgi:hypothetical protein